AVLIIALHPVLLLNVWRIHDGNLTALLLLSFLAAGIGSLRYRNNPSALLFGAITGLLFVVRPNTLFLFLVALFLIFWKTGRGEKIKSFLKAAIFLIGAIVLVVALNFAVKQKPFFFPPQGFYNVFAGSNEYSTKYLLKDYSGENSLTEALRARGFSSVDTFSELLSFPSNKYREFTIDFAKNNPLEYAKLTVLKVFTLFRPGYHVPEGFEWFSKEGLTRSLKIVLALPVFIWLFFVWKTRKNFFEKENLFVFVTVLLYIAPFFVANADPRYRFPLDIVFIADSFCRWQALRKGRFIS
ncbi:MAG: hypothetical protein AAB884_01180, partial [Patescibacteria group bacterium]